MELDVVIEIPKGQRNKYQVDHQTGRVYLDRYLFTAMEYPTDYGFIDETLGEDGDPLDAMLLLPEPLFPGVLVKARPVGMFRMSDEAGGDDKVLCVPAGDPDGITSKTSVMSRPSSWTPSSTSSCTTKTWSQANSSRLPTGSAAQKPKPKCCDRGNDSRPADTEQRVLVHAALARKRSASNVFARCPKRRPRRGLRASWPSR